MRIAVLAGITFIATTTTAWAADDYQWVFNDSGKVVELSYLIPDSDAINLIFSCNKADKRGSFTLVESTSKLEGKKKATLTLRVGGKDYKLKGKLSPNEEAGTPSFDTDIPLKSPVWAALAKAKDFETTIADLHDTHPLKGADMVKFVKACGK